MQLNYLLYTGAFSQKALDFFDVNGYLDEYEKFNLNECFNASLNGTTINGNSLPAFWDSIRKVGAIPQHKWTQIETAKKWEDLIKQPPQELLALGQKFLEYVKIEYEWVVIKDWNQNVPLVLKYHNKHAPVQIAAPVCPMWSRFTLKEGDIVATCPSVVPQHGTAQFFVSDTFINTFDTYNPFVKNLALDYPIPYGVKGVVTVNTMKKPKYIFTRDLTIGSKGDDVTALQKLLVASGDLVMPVGVAYGYFGGLTQKALSKFQLKNGISPSVGYMGSRTRAFIAQMK
jgi:hypothetical protein